MTILPGYVQTPFGGWVADDGTGPYNVVAEDSEAIYKQLSSGFWVKGDGSGPYFYNVQTGEAVKASSIFRSLT